MAFVQPPFTEAREDGRVERRYPAARGVFATSDVEQLHQAWMLRLRVDTVSNSARELGHFGSERTDDEGRCGVRTQKSRPLAKRKILALMRSHTPRPDLSEDPDGLLHLLPADRVTWRPSRKCRLLSGIRCIRTAAGAEAKHQAAPAQLLQRGRHDREDA